MTVSLALFMITQLLSTRLKQFRKEPVRHNKPACQHQANSQTPHKTRQHVAKRKFVADNVKRVLHMLKMGSQLASTKVHHQLSL